MIGELPTRSLIEGATCAGRSLVPDGTELRGLRPRRVDGFTGFWRSLLCFQEAGSPTVAPRGARLRRDTHPLLSPTGGYDRGRGPAPVVGTLVSRPRRPGPRGADSGVRSEREDYPVRAVVSNAGASAYVSHRTGMGARIVGHAAGLRANGRWRRGRGRRAGPRTRRRGRPAPRGRPTGSGSPRRPAPPRR